MTKSINSITRFILLIAGGIFLIWYIPVAYANVYACDDYWFGTNVSNYGFWGTQLYYWTNWEGSFTHTLLDSIPHIFAYERMPFVFNISSLCFFLCSLYCAFIVLFRCTKIDSIIYSLFLTAVLYTFTNGESEVRFWVSANSYIVELALLVFFIILYHQKDIGSSTIWYIFMPIVMFLIAGSKLTFILYAISSVVIHDVLLDNKPNVRTLAVVGGLLLFSLLNVLAPGNLIRLGVETASETIDSAYSIWDTFVIRCKQLLPFMGYSLLILPIALNLKQTINLTINKTFFLLASLLVIFTLDSAIMYICFNDPGPLRVYVLFELLTLFSVIILFANFNTVRKLNNYITYGIYVLSIIVLLNKNISLIKEIRPTLDFAEKSRSRNCLVKSSAQLKSYEKIELVPLPDSFLLLSYFSNDPEWLEYVYMPYFNKSCKVVIKESLIE